jgi:hypothetical protein
MIPLILLILTDSHGFVLTKNMQATNLKNERFLRGSVQMVAHLFEAADSLQDLCDIQSRCNVCGRFRAVFE